MGNVLLDEIRKSLESKNYTLESRLSDPKESNAEVWLATFKGNGKNEKRAIKISSPAFNFNDDMGNDSIKMDDLTQREIDLLRKINHPNIPAFRDYLSIPIPSIGLNLHLMAIEYIPAKNLQKMIEKRQTMNEETARTILKGCLSATQYIHEKMEQPVLHRDIKPSNVLFDGKKAYLFDFNLSQVGLKSFSATMINNYGYYPKDALSGRQTPSQDLCALGNTIIAATHGKSISELRNEEGKSHFCQVGIETLPFSLKLKSFLRKLTAENPAFRYQTASQAIVDLEQIDVLDETVLEEKVKKIERSIPVKFLLNELAKKDSCFEYNVPPKVRSSFDDDALIEHCRRAYEKDEVEIEDPKEIMRYAGIGDLVVKKGKFFEPKWKLTKGTIGRYIGIKGEKVKVSFSGIGGVEVPPGDLKVHNQKYWKSWGFDTHGNVMRDIFIGYRLNSLRPGDLEYVKKVIYDGVDIFSDKAINIPDGTKGVVSQFESDKLGIFWISNPGLKIDYNVYTVSVNDNFHPKIAVPYYMEAKEVKLLKQNTIQFSQIWEDCITKSKILN